MIKYEKKKKQDALAKAGWVEEAIEIFRRASKLEAKSNSQLDGSWARALSDRDGLTAAEEKLCAEGESEATKVKADGCAPHRIWGEILQ